MSANTRPQYNTYNTLPEIPAEPKRPVFRDPHTMDPRTWFRDLTPYFIYVLFIATLGPLLFGFHLVSQASHHGYSILTLSRLS